MLEISDPSRIASFTGEPGFGGIILDCRTDKGRQVDFRFARQVTAACQGHPVVALAERLSTLERIKMAQSGVARTLSPNASMASIMGSLRDLATSGQGKRLSVFVLIKDQVLAKRITGDLLEAGYSPHQFSEPSDMILEWFNQPPRVILMDYDTAEFRAAEFCRKLKSDIQLRVVQIIFVTRGVESEQRKQIYDCGADDYLALPYISREMLSKVASRDDRGIPDGPHGKATTEEVMRRMGPPPSRELLRECIQPVQLINGKVRVLIADDHQLVTGVLEHHMTREGWEVVTVEDGEQAEKMLSTQRFTLVLLDTSMPFRSGFDLLTWINSSGLKQFTRVIMLTAQDPDQTSPRAFALGADDVIRKPFNPETVMSRLKRYFNAVF
ncbi:MAG: response regulator [Myxococcota bacterium]